MLLEHLAPPQRGFTPAILTLGIAGRLTARIAMWCLAEKELFKQEFKCVAVGQANPCCGKLQF